MPNPMDEMTEEQKEYEAQKLVNMIDELSRWVFILAQLNIYVIKIVKYNKNIFLTQNMWLLIYFHNCNFILCLFFVYYCMLTWLSDLFCQNLSLF